ncbi:MAG TPA: hypothetical protein VMT99_03205 [Candidatus Paceibacterota bacterium]|nr:hypothetical protein [Candidatus Paceibacterota bacterium]
MNPIYDNIDAYIKEARARGMSDDALKTILSTSGWSAAEIGRALAGVPRPPQHAPGRNEGSPGTQALNTILVVVLVLAAAILGYIGYLRFLVR